MPTIYKQKIVAGGLTFNDPAALVPNALACGVDVCDGWKSTPAPEVIATDFGVLRDGMELGDVFPVRARYIILGGYAYASDQASAELVHDALVREAFPRNKTLKMVRYESVPKYVYYRRSAEFETDWSAVPNGFRWQTTVLCVDPFKYSLTQQVGSAGTAGASTTGVQFPITFPFSFSALTSGAATTTVGILNAGNAPSRSFSAVLTGPLAQGNWRLRNDTNDGELFFYLTLTAADTLRLDFATQTAYLNGFPYVGKKVGDWFALDPGNNEMRLYADFNASTTVTVTAESAWE